MSQRNDNLAVDRAIVRFWATRAGQLKKQKKSNLVDHGNRGAVTGGKQMDGFVDILTELTVSAGIPRKYIFTKEGVLPGFFRPTKDWDFVVISPQKNLISCIELKSQVGSFGNNFNNRTEEALGNAVDIWTAYREGSFSCQSAPWLGFLMVIEKSSKSTSSIKIAEPHFRARKEFNKSSYLKRYELLCKKLMRERLYTSTCLIWTKRSKQKANYGYLDSSLSFKSFANAYFAYLRGRKSEFEV